MRPQREMIAQLSGEEAMVVAMPRLLANEPLWPSAASTWSFVQPVALLDVLTWVQVLAAVNTYEQARWLPARSRLATAQPR